MLIPWNFSRILADIDAECGNIAKITITQGKIHKYLGMTIEYFLSDNVNFSMVNNIGNIIDEI